MYLITMLHSKIVFIVESTTEIFKSLLSKLCLYKASMNNTLLSYVYVKKIGYEILQLGVQTNSD